MSFPTARSSSSWQLGTAMLPFSSRSGLSQHLASAQRASLPLAPGASACSRQPPQPCSVRRASASAQPADSGPALQQAVPVISLQQLQQQQGKQATRWDWGQLPDTARVALFTGTYITVAGMLALLFPRQLFGLLFPASKLSAGWVRVGGTLATLFGAYYLGAALDDCEGRKPLRMYQSTVLGRALLAAIFAALVWKRECGWGLLLLAAANAAGAWRMAVALRRDGVRWGWRLPLPGWLGAVAGWLGCRLALLCVMVLSIVL